MLLDLRSAEACKQAVHNCDHVFQLAADMGGMGWLETNQATCLINNTLINVNMLRAACQQRCKRYFFASSACAYPDHLQTTSQTTGLKETDAWPAAPGSAYGLEKLFIEEACRHVSHDFHMGMRIARFHNVYGPMGTWKGGREKSPAALCRKVAVTPDEGSVEVWGDGKQTRSYIYIDDLVEGCLRLMASDHAQVQAHPLNLGTEDLISINELADLIAYIAKKRIKKTHIPGPQGVRGRNSDNTLMEFVLGWSPTIPLAEGLARTYAWIEDQLISEIETGIDMSLYAHSHIVHVSHIT